MAEINVARKERASWLPWVLGLVALGAIIYLLTRGGDDTVNDGNYDPTREGTGSLHDSNHAPSAAELLEGLLA